MEGGKSSKRLVCCITQGKLTSSSPMEEEEYKRRHGRVLEAMGEQCMRRGCVWGGGERRNKRQVAVDPERRTWFSYQEQDLDFGLKIISGHRRAIAVVV
ncbi:hypothetical protein BHE74_00048486 [Ensete ventricosum]|nr:hypothetical protein GW17_00022938 [Ensete ventricosum]RWW45651.1 hypothetical protein BHE74_00048486 [Ensete ventricosum]RZS21555.1 hypothetical protein BHM03_00054211 [Ensete ventricosum]